MTDNINLDRDTVQRVRQALILLGNYIGNTWEGSGGIPPFDRCALIGKLNDSLQAPGKLEPVPTVMPYSVMLRRPTCQYANITVVAASAQEAVSLALQEKEDNMPWEDAEVTLPIDWVQAEGFDHAGNTDHFQWNKNDE